MRLILLVFIFISTSWTAWGQDRLPETFDVVYDPSQLSDPVGQEKTLLNQLNEVMKQSLADHSKEYFVPLAPQTEEELKSFRMLSDEQAEKFLHRKQEFLEKISLGLRWLHIPKGLHNKAMEAFNLQLFAGAPAIARANAIGGNVRINVGGGLGVALSEEIRNGAISRYLPKSGGFFIGLGFGVSIVKVDTLEGARWVFEVFADVTTLKSVKTLLGTVGGDLTVAYVAELRYKIHGSRFKNLTADVLGVLGTTHYNDSMFYYGLGGGPAVPPVIDKVMIYSLNENRLTILSIDLEFIRVIQDKLKKWFPRTFAPRCSKAFL